jgi:hypothetical protein
MSLTPQSPAAVLARLTDGLALEVPSIAELGGR